MIKNLFKNKKAMILLSSVSITTVVVVSTTVVLLTKKTEKKDDNLNEIINLKFSSYENSSENIKTGIFFEVDEKLLQNTFSLKLLNKETNSNININSEIKDNKLYFDFNNLEKNTEYEIKEITSNGQQLKIEISNLAENEKTFLIRIQEKLLVVKELNFSKYETNQNNLITGVFFDLDEKLFQNNFSLKLKNKKNSNCNNNDDCYINLPGKIKDKKLYFSFIFLKKNTDYEIQNINSFISEITLNNLNDKLINIPEFKDEIEIEKIKWKNVSFDSAIIEVFYKKDITKLAFPDKENTFYLNLIEIDKQQNKIGNEKALEFKTNEYNNETNSAIFYLNNLNKTANYKILNYKVNESETKEINDNSQIDTKINLTHNFKNLILNYNLRVVNPIDKNGKKIKDIINFEIELKSQNSNFDFSELNLNDENEDLENGAVLLLTLKDLKTNKNHVISLVYDTSGIEDEYKKEIKNKNIFRASQYFIKGINSDGNPCNSGDEDCGTLGETFVNELTDEEIMDIKNYFDEDKIDEIESWNFNDKFKIIDLKIIYDRFNILNYKDNEKSKEAINDFYENNIINLLPEGNNEYFLDFSIKNSTYQSEIKYENNKLIYTIEPEIIDIENNNQTITANSIKLLINTSFGPKYELIANKNSENKWIAEINNPPKQGKYFLNKVIANENIQLFKKDLTIKNEFILVPEKITISNILFNKNEKILTIEFNDPERTLYKYEDSVNFIKFKLKDQNNSNLFESVLFFDKQTKKWKSKIQNSLLNQKIILESIIFGNNSESTLDTKKEVNLDLNLIEADQDNLNELINKLTNLKLNKKWWAYGIKKKLQSIITLKQNSILNLIELTNIAELIPDILKYNIKFEISEFTNQDEHKGTLNIKLRFISNQKSSNEKIISLTNLINNNFILELRNDPSKAAKYFDSIIKVSVEGKNKSSIDFDKEFPEIFHSIWDANKGFGINSNWIDTSQDSILEKLSKYITIDESLLSYDKTKVKLYFIKLKDDLTTYFEPKSNPNSIFGMIQYLISFWMKPEDFDKQDPESRHTNITTPLALYNLNNPKHNIVALLKENFENLSLNNNEIFNEKYGLKKDINSFINELNKKNSNEKWDYILKNSNLEKEWNKAIFLIKNSVANYRVVRDNFVYEMLKTEIITINNEKFLDVYLALKTNFPEYNFESKIIYNEAIKLRFKSIN
ncbi:hypothetical protein [[Mycoplasma] collis]|uniref:hypothetical protein n=1 Tax=[Mycoplasma] collis TaxID=2127 RepID=UPI00051BB5B9|nr:hypothetical protein [[Mycoplasma] collis]